jgi:DNA processing protein
MKPPTTVCLGREHPQYPIQIAAMERPPKALYLKGLLPAGPSVAIVGSRAATDEALRFAQQLAFDLAKLGVSVWSGGARGVDAAAHRGALEAGASSVVVMGTGFEQIYPADHEDMFIQMLERGGAWVSMFPDEQRGTKWTFLLRNELLASLVDAVILVQAPVRSGARSTVAAARRMGRRVWVVPAAPWDVMGAGCTQELRLGAEVLPTFAGIAKALGKQVPRGHSARTSSALPTDLDPEERAVALAVRRGCRHSDDICSKTGLSAHIVAAALLTLSLRHVLVQGSDGQVHAVT